MLEGIFALGILKEKRLQVQLLEIAEDLWCLWMVKVITGKSGIYFGNQKIEVRGLSGNDQYEIAIFDLMGNRLKWNETSVGMDIYSAAVNDFPSGMYLIQVVNKSNGHVTVEKFALN